jgi:uncharacterized protein YdcH (DUF465 family)
MIANEIKRLAQTRMAEVKAEIATVQKQTLGLREARAALIAEHSALGARIEAMTQDINAVEQPGLTDLKVELGTLARMSGGY